MGSCFSCRVSHNETKERSIPSIARPASRHAVPAKPNEDLNENSSVVVPAKETASRQTSLSTLNGAVVRPHSGRQKKLSICSTYSGRENFEIPTGFPEDCVLTIHDMYNILNDGSLNAYIHDEGNILLIDCRDVEEYDKMHIITAKQADNLQNGNFQMGMGYNMYNIVVIYGGNVKGDRRKLHDTWSDISANVAGEVLILSSGFDAFYERFPFMCSEQCIQSNWERKRIVAYPSAVINDKLYQGKGEQATNKKVLDDLKITHIINITKEHPNKFGDDIVYLRLALEDESKTDLKKHFEVTCEFITKALKKNGVVFVHCNLGVSRSSTVVLAYLMKTQRISLSDALTFLKSRRSCARPNIGFLSQLSDWEESILGRKVTRVDDL